MHSILLVTLHIILLVSASFAQLTEPIDFPSYTDLPDCARFAFDTGWYGLYNGKVPCTSDYYCGCRESFGEMLTAISGMARQFCTSTSDVASATSLFNDFCAQYPTTRPVAITAPTTAASSGGEPQPAATIPSMNSISTGLLSFNSPTVYVSPASSTSGITSAAVGGIVGGILGTLLLVSVAVTFYLLGRRNRALPTILDGSAGVKHDANQVVVEADTEIHQPENPVNVPADIVAGGRLRHLTGGEIDGGRIQPAS